MRVYVFVQFIICAVQLVLNILSMAHGDFPSKAHPRLDVARLLATVGFGVWAGILLFGGRG